MKEPAHVAYDAFLDAMQGVDHDGVTLRLWHELMELERDAWRVAIAAVS